MRDWVKANGWELVISGIGALIMLVGGFLCVQIFTMRGELSEVKATLTALNSNMSELKNDAKAAYSKFDSRHEALSDKINEVDKRLNAIEVSVRK